MADEPGIFEVMYTMRAMRRLKPDPVPEDVLLKLVDAANQAPSGSNAQTARWVIVRDPEIKRRVADLNRKAVEAYAGMSVDSPPTAQDAEARRRRSFLWQTRHMHEMPALIVACQEFAGPRADTFAAGAGAGGSIWPGVQNLLLAARALGLGAVPTTLALSDRRAFKAVLGLPENVEPFCMVPIGYPKGKFGPVTRRPLSEIVHWDRW